MVFQALNRVLHSHDNSAAVQMKLYEYFKLHGYACPTDSSNGAFVPVGFRYQRNLLSAYTQGP